MIPIYLTLQYYIDLGPPACISLTSLCTVMRVDIKKARKYIESNICESCAGECLIVDDDEFMLTESQSIAIIAVIKPRDEISRRFVRLAFMAAKLRNKGADIQELRPVASLLGDSASTDFGMSVFILEAEKLSQTKI